MTMSASEVMQNPQPDAVRRGRLKVVLIFVIGFAPFILATLMYYSGWGIPHGRVNHGELLLPTVPVAQLGLHDAKGQPLTAQFAPAAKNPSWMLLILAPHCDQRCVELLHTTRQVNIALGKDANRLSRAFWSPQPPAGIDLATAYPQLQRLQASPAPATWPGKVEPSTLQIYVIDPHGNLVLRYDQQEKGKGMLDDLKRLLRLSQIG